MKLKVLIAAGMMDRKFYSKIEPIVENDAIEKIYLARLEPYTSHPKINCYSPTGKLFHNKALAEIFRIFTMTRIILTVKPDLLIGIGMIPHGLFTSVLGRLFRKKTILLLMGKNDLFLTYPDRKIRKWILLSIAKWADMIGTRGTRSKEWLIRKGVPEEKIFIPHNVFDFTEFSPLEQPKIYDLIYVGMINYYKRIDLLIDVADKLVNKHGFKSLKLAIIGTGKLKTNLITYTQKKGLADHIDFLNTGDKKYINNYLNQSKIFIMTSQGEGLPMVAIEAMSCGIPVAIFDDADISDVCWHNYNSLLSPLGDTDSLANNVYQMLINSDLYAKLALGAAHLRNEKGEEYSLRSIINCWNEALYKL